MKNIHDTIDGIHYYIQDYMGNNRLVVNASTESIEQVTHYYPYGGVIGDISTNESVQKYKFEGKELDRTFGLDNYDIGARQYFAMAPMWDRIDPLAEKYYGISPYVYCAGNPVNNLDKDGRKVVFVNGYLGFGSPEGDSPYWNGSNSSFVRNAQSAFQDDATPYFTNYDFKYLQSASTSRDFQGYQYAKQNYKALTQGMKTGDQFNFVSHSMGGAFTEGMIRYLTEQGWKTENAVYLNAWEPAEIKGKEEKTRIDATCTNDPVQWLSKPVFGEPDIPSSDDKIRITSEESIQYIHRDLIDGNSNNLWKLIKEFLKK